jgi:phosphotransferase system IIB component
LIPILILILGSVFVTMILALIRNLPSRSKAGKDYSEVLSLLGGKANIINVAQQGSRITLWVSDQSRCDYQKLKELGATGVFISGDTIKIMWPNEAQELANYLKKNVQEPQS